MPSLRRRLLLSGYLEVYRLEYSFQDGMNRASVAMDFATEEQAIEHGLAHGLLEIVVTKAFVRKGTLND